MMYKTSKLAEEISKITDLNKMVVWDVLNELNYQPSELTKTDVNRWSMRVERAVYDK